MIDAAGAAVAAETISKSLGHIALHTRPGMGVLAARLFEILGCRVKAYPIGNDEMFYIIALNERSPDTADNVIFMSPMTPQQDGLESAIIELLKIGTESEHPAVEAFQSMITQKPEMYLHFGVHFRSLEQLERVILDVEREAAADSTFGKHIRGIQRLRAKRGIDETIDARMDESLVFGKASMECYGPNLVQAHILNDLFATGFGFTGSVLELDFVFRGDGRHRHPFNSLGD